MAAHSLTLTREIDAPAEDVWHVLTHVEDSATILSGVSEIEMLTDGPYAVGTRWRETRTMMGGSETEEMWVAEVDEPRSTVIRAEARGATYVTTFTLEPTENGTRLTMTFAGGMEKPGLVMRVLGPITSRLGLAMSKKMMTQDLADIATAAEGLSRP